MRLWPWRDAIFPATANARNQRQRGRGGGHYRRYRPVVLTTNAIGGLYPHPLPANQSQRQRPVPALARSSNLKPQVGQVVILQRETAQPADGAQAGIIRRMLCVDADTLEAGIQFIRGTTHPIMVRTAGEQGSAQPALWIDGGDGRNSTLMVALAMYQRSQKFIIEGGLPAAVVAVEKLVECTPNFARFLYRIESA
jgi:hypothetical protein